MPEIGAVIAFLAGIASFLSPCIIPLVPAFLGYLSGTSVKTGSRWLLFSHAFLFVLGFSTVFALLGVLLNSVLSSMAFDVQLWLSRIAGVVVIAFGLYLVGLFKPAFLEREHKLRVHQFSSRHLTSFVFGAAFAVGWTPCVSAILGSILALAASNPGTAFGLLMAYALGLGIPFLIVGLFAQPFLRFVQKYSGFLKYFNFVVGVLMIVLGVLVFTQKLTAVANLGFVLDTFFK